MGRVGGDRRAGGRLRDQQQPGAVHTVAAAAIATVITAVITAVGQFVVVIRLLRQPVVGIARPPVSGVVGISGSAESSGQSSPSAGQAPGEPAPQRWPQPPSQSSGDASAQSGQPSQGQSQESATAKLSGRPPILCLQIVQQANLLFQLVESVTTHGLIASIGRIRQSALALFPQLIGHSTYNWLLRFLSASLVAITTLVEPLASAVLAYFILREIPSRGVMIGGILILIGIYLAIRPRNA